MYIRITFFIIVALFSNILSAKVVDKTTVSEDHEYQIHFCYRPSPDFSGFPGHAYVGFWKKPAAGGNVQYRAFGATLSNSTEFVSAIKAL